MIFGVSSGTKRALRSPPNDCLAALLWPPCGFILILSCQAFTEKPFRAPDIINTIRWVMEQQVTQTPAMSGGWCSTSDASKISRKVAAESAVSTPTTGNACQNDVRSRFSGSDIARTKQSCGSKICGKNTGTCSHRNIVPQRCCVHV